MQNQTYTIESESGQEMTGGLQLPREQVLALAQRWADELGAPVFVFDSQGNECGVEPKEAKS